MEPLEHVVSTRRTGMADRGVSVRLWSGRASYFLRRSSTSLPDAKPSFAHLGYYIAFPCVV